MDYPLPTSSGVTLLCPVGEDYSMIADFVLEDLARSSNFTMHEITFDVFAAWYSNAKHIRETEERSWSPDFPLVFNYTQWRRVTGTASGDVENTGDHPLPLMGTFLDDEGILVMQPLLHDFGNRQQWYYRDADNDDPDQFPYAWTGFEVFIRHDKAYLAFIAFNLEWLKSIKLTSEVVEMAYEWVVDDDGPKTHKLTVRHEILETYYKQPAL